MEIQRNHKTGFPIARVAGDLFPIPEDWIYAIHRTKSVHIDSILKNGLDYRKYPTVLSMVDWGNTEKFWQILTDDLRKNPAYDTKIVFTMPKSELEYYKQEYSNGIIPVRYLVAVLPNYGGTVPLKIQDTHGALFDRFESERSRFPQEFLNRDPQEKLNIHEIELLKNLVSERMLLPIYKASEFEINQWEDDREDWLESGLCARRISQIPQKQKSK